MSSDYQLFVDRIASVQFGPLETINTAYVALWKASGPCEPSTADPRWVRHLAAATTALQVEARILAQNFPPQVLDDPEFDELWEAVGDVLALRSGIIAGCDIVVTPMDVSGLSLPSTRDFFATLPAPPLVATIQALGRIANGVIHPGDEPLIHAIPGWSYLTYPQISDWVVLEFCILGGGIYLNYCMSLVTGGPFGPEPLILTGPFGGALTLLVEQSLSQSSSVGYYDRYFKGVPTPTPSSGASGGSGGSEASGGSHASGGSEASGGSSGASEGSHGSSAGSSTPSGGSTPSSSVPSSAVSSSKSAQSSLPSHPSSGSSHSSSSGSICSSVIIIADSNRDGVVDMADDLPPALRLQFNRTVGAICLVNADHDRDPPLSGATRFHDRDDLIVQPGNDPQELAEIRIVRTSDKLIGYPLATVVEMSLQPPPNEPELVALNAPQLQDRVRVWRTDSTQPQSLGAMLGRGVGMSAILNVDEVNKLNNLGFVSFWVEGCEHACDVTLQVQLRVGTIICATSVVRMMPAPLIAWPDSLPAEWAIVTDPSGRGANAVRDRIQTHSPETRVYDGDQWAQDEWELGMQSWPDQYLLPHGTPGILRAGVDLPRQNGDLDAVGKRELTGAVTCDLESPKPWGSWVEFEVTGAFPDESGNYGGNIECTPPYTTAGGDEFAFGRVVIGSTLADSRLLDHIRRQRIQVNGAFQPIVLDTDWLTVGHVDEAVTFVHSTSGTHGFKVVAADASRAQTVLAGVAPSTALFYNTALLERPGVVTAAGLNWIEDAAQNFSAEARRFVRIWSGTGVGQIAEVIAHSGARLTIGRCWLIPDMATVDAFLIDAVYPPFNQAAWVTQPAAGDQFVLIGDTQWWRGRVQRAGRFVSEKIPAATSAAEVLADALLWTLNLTAASGSVTTEVAGMVNTLVTEGVVAPADVVPIPALCCGKGSPATGLTARSAYAYVPGMVNCVAIGNTLVVARPWGPRDAAGTDLFMKDFQDQLMAHSAPVPAAADFVDDWELYHTRMGEVHCGTNIRRIPSTGFRSWWTKWGRAP